MSGGQKTLAVANHTARVFERAETVLFECAP